MDELRFASVRDATSLRMPPNFPRCQPRRIEFFVDFTVSATKFWYSSTFTYKYEYLFYFTNTFRYLLQELISYLASLTYYSSISRQLWHRQADFEAHNRKKKVQNSKLIADVFNCVVRGGRRIFLFCKKVQIGFGAQPAFYSMGTGVLSRGQSDRNLM
jgi:hypothetical protein